MIRLDLLLVQKGYAKSRSAAAGLIKEGRVTVNGKTAVKPSEIYDESCNIQINYPLEQYVSRGGYKLAAAIEGFAIDVKDKICLDIGASTGGFTDCLLQNGAKKVYAVDCGHSQLDDKIKNNPNVVNIEQINARFLKKADFSDKIDLIVMDVSFISQTLIYPACGDILAEGGVMVTLVKPQFELDKSKISKNGIVKDEKGIYFNEIKAKITKAAENNSFRLVDIIWSPITGGDGNKEYLAYFVRRNSHEGIGVSQPE